jgi:hypothetical protein
MKSSSDYFITYAVRPKKIASRKTLDKLDSQLPLLAIVIQGPVITKDDFTFETIKLYKQNFPKAVIILSTWQEDKQKVGSNIVNADIHILFNEKPCHHGTSNINLQIATSKQGILKAEKLGAELVMKTRTDQRMYAPNISRFLFDIINLFPLKSNIVKQQKRIIGVSLNTFKYRMYGLSDMLMYGHIDDMLLFWDIPFDSRKFNSSEKNAAVSSLRSFAKWRICEVFLTTEFLKKVDRKLEWTLEDSWKVYADHFCVIDRESLDLYWGKYGLEEYPWTNYSNEINVFEQINFREWLNLNCNPDGIKPSEKILDLPLK